MIIVNLEAEMVTLRKDLPKTICRTTQKFWMTLSELKLLIMKSSDFDTIRQKNGSRSKAKK
jgi:hypothetical protein